MALAIINVYRLDIHNWNNWNQIGLFTRMAEKAQPAFKASDFSFCHYCWRADSDPVWMFLEIFAGDTVRKYTTDHAYIDWKFHAIRNMT